MGESGASATGLRVLNEAFSVAGYNGGESDKEHGVQNVLKPGLRPFHCSGDGVGHILDLSIAAEEGGDSRDSTSATAAVLTHLAIHGAPGCSDRLRRGRVWLADSVDLLGKGEPILAFETDSVKAEWSGALPKPTLARAVRISFDATHGEGENVDVGLIALVGVMADDPRPDVAVCQEPIPASLGVTGLQLVKKRKRWMPLESNPRVVSKYLRTLGFDSRFELHELLSLETWALEMIPRPVRAIFLLFPIGKETEAVREASAADGRSPLLPADVVHMKQLIGNACGTIAVVHVMANLCRHGSATPEPDSWLERFLTNYREGLTSDDVGSMLEEDRAIEQAHAEAERESEAQNHRSNANLHFIAFVELAGLAVELDGRSDHPHVVGQTSVYGGDFLQTAVEAIRNRYMNVSPDALRFNMMALCGGPAGAMDSANAGAGNASAALEISEEAISQLCAFGFDKDAARTALEATNGNLEAAANLLLG